MHAWSWGPNPIKFPWLPFPNFFLPNVVCLAHHVHSSKLLFQYSGNQVLVLYHTERLTCHFFGWLADLVLQKNLVAITNLQVSICLLIIRMKIYPGKTKLDICSIKKFIHQTRHLKFSINLKWILMLENVRNATLPTKAHIWTKQLKRHISWFILTYKRQLWAVFHYGLNALLVRPECH